jgi:RNA polymerase sigma-70 factor, ECF subfamily
MSDSILADVFLGERAGWSGVPEALAVILAAHLAAGREAWPDAVLTEAAFIRHLARVLPAEAGEEELRGLRGADVYVACACAGGDEQAMVAFERRYFGEVDVAAARLRAAPQAATEVKQMLRRILFVSEGTRVAAAASFAGRGDLRGWIRVAAVRELQRILIREKRAVPLDEDQLLDVLSPAQDPELAYLRDLYRTGFAEAVRVAMAAAPAKERALLRYHVMDGLNIEAIGRLYDVHRATVARWLEKARAGILARTREELTRRLGISPDEVDSIIRLVQSRLDVSMERVLAP